MTSTYTTNKVIEKPGSGDYANTWNVPVNSDWDIIDQAFGGTTSLNATAGSATLSSTQYRSLIISISGAISAGVTYTIPSGVGGQWIIRNTTTDSSGGPWTVTIASAGGGTNVTVDRNLNIVVFCDGTNVRFTNTAAGGIGSNTQVIFNSSGSLAGSANMTWDGTTFTASNLSTGGNITATGTITATGAITSSAAVTAFSDRNLKEGISTIQNSLEKVNRMRGVHYTMINSGQKGIGVIAQEVREIFPEIVLDNNGILSVAYGNIVGVLIEAIKELTARLDILEKK